MWITTAVSDHCSRQLINKNITFQFTILYQFRLLSKILMHFDEVQTRNILTYSLNFLKVAQFISSALSGNIFMVVIPAQQTLFRAYIISFIEISPFTFFLFIENQWIQPSHLYNSLFFFNCRDLNQSKYKAVVLQIFTA